MHPVGLQPAQQLAQQQRVAAGGAVARGHEGIVRLLAEAGPDEIPDSVQGQRLGPDGNRGQPVGELGQQALRVGRLPGAHGPHDQDRHPLEPVHQEGEELLRADVAPLQVVDGEQQRLFLGQVGGQPVQAVRDAEQSVAAPIAGAGRVAVRQVETADVEDRCCRAGRAGEPPLPPLGVGEHRLEQLPDQAEAEVLLELAAASGQGHRSGGRAQPAHLGQQPALADAGPALDQGESRLAGQRVVQADLQLGQLAVAVHQVGGGPGPRRGCHRRRCGHRLWGSGRRGVQGGGLRQHLGLERAQGRSRVDAELVGEGAPGAAQRGQGVGLPVPGVKGQHEQPPALLA